MSPGPHPGFDKNVFINCPFDRKYDDRLRPSSGPVKTLVLSHFVPGDDASITDEQWSEGARKYFKGQIVVEKI
jgi:hypothetical protein